MREWQSQSHVRWYCRYHVVWVPKYRKQAIKSAADPGRTCARSRPPQNGHGPRHSTPARFQPAATAADSIWVQVSIGVHLLGMLSATPRLWPSR